jgi:hypothetical protein
MRQLSPILGLVASVLIESIDETTATHLFNRSCDGVLVGRVRCGFAFRSTANCIASFNPNVCIAYRI